MPKAQCYYEILGISESATTEDVKRAYKKEALVWHPDKNQTNPEEAHTKFQAILKAYETLSDNREREWYDRHKDQILSEGNKEDLDCLNLFQYFSSACYANFNDEEDGFYTVYRNVFEMIAEEERQTIQRAERYAKGKSKKDFDVTFPTFGNSESAYEEVVRPFYAYWSGFATKLTFDHLDKYNTTEAENRRIARAMEKENSKLKDAAKKERNTNVRNLVEFIKKRDRRLKAQKLLVEQQNELNRQKTAEKQRLQRQRDLKEKVAYKPNTYLHMNDLEDQLNQLDNEYQDLKKGKRSRRRQKYSDEEEEDVCDDGQANCDRSMADDEIDLNSVNDVKNPSGIEADRVRETSGYDRDGDGRDEDEGERDLDEEEQEQEEQVEGFFCPACNKEFQTIGAFQNHEASKKHKQNVQRLTKLLKEEEEKLNK